MRTLLLLLALGGLLPGRAAHGQALPTDAQGRVAFCEVVPADSLPAGRLYTLAKAWLRRRGYQLAVADSAGGRLVATNAFGVYDHGYATKKLHGKIQYQLTIEVKKGRYRQQFTDFVFAYYAEDRTYHLAPTGKTKPLEDPTASGWAHLWQSHREATHQTVDGLAAELKAALLARPKPLAGATRPAADW
ncbi:hypothetical protein GCM10023172_15490 [Hymenobacter ginsengisoli]|uniref:DUF4468 domain-containing protein n=1 Tax=Hymenobacter ginsengisoli TaxID=1051626 RepID=A0ABP8Q940_9BACT|nr:MULTISPECIES: DUF4468 domain-containing protein [unclassified Hymenobacter]MBO2030901.1 DUF4468 domain-containing protein [Hymenobacter sp. BT559]